MAEAPHRGRRPALVALVVIGFAIAATTLLTFWRGSAAPAGPPEAIVEGFVQALARHDYEAAVPYLTEHMLAQTIPLTLEVRMNELERRTGNLRDVRGVPRWSVGTRAYAAAEADTERSGPFTIGFGLRLEENGSWRIDELYELGWKPKGVQ